MDIPQALCCGRRRGTAAGPCGANRGHQTGPRPKGHQTLGPERNDRAVQCALSEDRTIVSLGHWGLSRQRGRRASDAESSASASTWGTALTSAAEEDAEKEEEGSDRGAPSGMLPIGPIFCTYRPLLAYQKF